jgi:hypothetical protein
VIWQVFGKSEDEGFEIQFNDCSDITLRYVTGETLDDIKCGRELVIYTNFWPAFVLRVSVCNQLW